MNIAAVETSLMLATYQITEGDVSCDACDERAVAKIATGADPDPAPYCARHAHWMIAAHLDVFSKLFLSERAV